VLTRRNPYPEVRRTANTSRAGAAAHVIVARRGLDAAYGRLIPADIRRCAPHAYIGIIEETESLAAS